MRNGNTLANKLNRARIFTTAHTILWLLLVIFIYKNVMLPALRSDKPFGIYQNNGVTTIIDFPSHFNFTKKVWLSRPHLNADGSVYSINNHLNATNNWAGTKINYSLPFGYSPTMLWLLAPLVLFTHEAAFCLFNLAGLWSIWWQTRPSRCRLGVGLLTYFSSLSFACLQLGQTALLSGAGLLYLAENNQHEHSGGAGLRNALYSGTVLWLLTAKPPLALTAGAVLLSLRKWQPILVALIFTIIMSFVISPLLGAGWIHDYWTMIKTYDLVQADPVYAWSLVPAHMANLRGILNIDFHVADNLASRLSLIMWLFSLLWMITAGAQLKLQKAAYWALGILFYLLFCPHVSSTEELQLVLLLPLCIPVMQEKLNQRELALFAIILLLPFMSPAVGPFFLDIRWGLLSAKLFLVFFIVYHYWGNRALNAETLTGKLMAI